MSVMSTLERMTSTWASHWERGLNSALFPDDKENLSRTLAPLAAASCMRARHCSRLCLMEAVEQIWPTAFADVMC